MDSLVNCRECGTQFEVGCCGSEGTRCPECTRADNRRRYHARMEKNKRAPDPYRHCSVCGIVFLYGIIGSEGNRCPECVRTKNRARYHKNAGNPILPEKRICSACGREFIRGENGSMRGRCPECFSKYKKEYTLANSESIREKRHNYLTNNKDHVAKLRRASYGRNRDKIIKRNSEYFEANKDWLIPKRNANRTMRLNEDTDYRLKYVLSSRVRMAVNSQGTGKSKRTMELVGCTVPELVKYLEAQFKPGMTWGNHGNHKDEWNIDHIVPCAFFDLSDPEEQKKCFHFSNMQPM
jgi:hypothetical protein